MTLTGLTTFLMQIGQQLSFSSVMEEVSLVSSRQHCFHNRACQQVLSARMRHKRPSIISILYSLLYRRKLVQTHLLPWNKRWFSLSLPPAVRINKRFKAVVGIHCPTRRRKCTQAHRQFFIQKDIGWHLLWNVTFYKTANDNQLEDSVHEAIKNIKLWYTTVITDENWT